MGSSSGGSAIGTLGEGEATFFGLTSGGGSETTVGPGSEGTFSLAGFSFTAI